MLFSKAHICTALVYASCIMIVTGGNSYEEVLHGVKYYFGVLQKCMKKKFNRSISLTHVQPNNQVATNKIAGKSIDI
jgi:hypothetical protein